MSESAIFEAVAALQEGGHYLAAHDQAMAAIAAGSTHEGLRHRAVLTLAQAGASGSALRLFERLGMAASTAPELAALGARLLKDRALAAPPGERHGAARAAETAYGALWRRTGAAWHGMNAAAMALLAGAPGRARERVAALGALQDSGDYWAAATEAEAALLQGDDQACRRWLETAEARAGPDLAARLSTRRQLRWIAGLSGADPAIVDGLRIPPTVHFCGAIPTGPDSASPAPEARLEAKLAEALDGVRFGFGSLAAGADILIAEALLDRGAELTIVLPFPPDLFAARSVTPAGAAWRHRFEACLAQARVIVLEAAAQDDLDFAMASRRAMGLALLHARRIDGPVWQVAVPKPTPRSDVAGTAADLSLWASSGARTIRLDSPWQPGPTDRSPPPERALHAVLFSDLPGFGQLDDAAFIAFYDGPQQALGGLVEGAIYRNSWGDAVQLVFDHPLDAARCALRIQDGLSAEAFQSWGLPPSLVPRLALDFGPLRPVHDPVQGISKFAGRVMTRAARIEPVTPPGLIYATEAFACEIALSPSAPVACDYAGLVPTAKGFGTLPLYALRAP